MAKRPVFFSFHFDIDVFRVQQVRNMGVIEGNEPVKPNEWETVKGAGEKAVENWIEKTMKNKDCVIVLIGEETYKRPWVDFEIRKAWRDKKPLLGIHIHNLNCMKNGYGKKGKNPFEEISMTDGSTMAKYVTTYDPKSSDAYKDISTNINSWIETAIKSR